MREEAPILTIDENGDKYWRNKEGELHRIDGPAIEYGDGTKEWHKNGKLHRIDGPAVEYSNGIKHWYQNGVLHRTKEAFFEALNDEEKEIALFSEAFLNA